MDPLATEDEGVETLNCIGGPLHTKRLLVPAGLKWFAFAKNEFETCEAAKADGVVDFTLIKGIISASTKAQWDPDTDPRGAYVRKTFVTGEAGLSHTFVYQE